jgi:di/tricarboxylate transporter
MLYLDIKAEKALLGQTLIWLLVLIVPFVLYSVLSTSFNYQQSLFLSLVSSVVLLWIFRLVPDFVAGLSFIILLILLDVVPQSIALVGFTSNIFFLVFGIFVLAAMLAQSQWIEYFEYHLLKNKNSIFRKAFSLVMLTLGLTLIVPSPLGRSTMITPLLRRFFKKGNTKNNTYMALSHIHGSTLFSTIFLSGNPLNFVLLAMLDSQTQGRFQWMPWLYAVWVTGFILSVFLVLWLYITNRILFKVTDSEQKPIPNAPKLDVTDFKTLFLYGLLFLGLFTQSYHEIPLSWLVVLLAMFVFFFSGLSLNKFKKGIDWATLLFLASVVAWGPMIEYLQLSNIFSHLFEFLLPFFDHGSVSGILALSLLVLLVRLIVPGAPAFIILATAFLPFSYDMGLNPWLLGFILLTLSESFILPYQHGVLAQTLTEMDNEATRYSMKAIISTNLIFYALRVLAIIASIPWWKTLYLL